MKPSRSSSDNSTWLSGLALYFWPKVQLVRQTELAECGLACMAMIASYYGLLMDLSHLRKIYPIGPQGMHMGNLLGLATKLGLQGRAVKLEADELANLKLPAILHWNMNHFVVLSKVKRGRALLYDPALGRHWVRFNELERQFTGVALELEPSSQFQRGERRHEIQLRTMLGRVQGLWPNLSHIFLLSFSLEVLVLSSPLITQWVVDEVMVSFDKDLLLLVVMAGVAIGVSELLCTTVRTWVITHFATRLATAWQQRIMQHLLRLKLDFFEKRHVGDILSRLGSAQSIQKLLTTDIVEAILDGITGIITLCLMLTYSVKLTLIALGAVVIFAALRAIRYRPVRQIQESIIVSDAELESHTLETLRGMQAVKLFQLEQARLQEWLRRLVLNTNHDLNMVKTNMAFHAAERLLGVTETALILWLGANLVLAGEFSVGAYLAFGAWKAQFVSRMDALVNKAVQIGFVRLYAERLADIVYSPLDLDDTAAQSAIAADPSAGLVVENIAYRYAVNTNWVFQGLSLHIQLGEFVAISGASGRGKSTLLKVLLGLLDAQQGEIKWQGTPLHQWGSAYRPQIAAVMQDDSLFAGTLADNISLFDVPVDGQKMMECAQIACIHDEIVAMTMGYQTLVGDMGSTLSGGQKQRVLLARALYRKPQLLVLDEATSSLDTELERRINKNIQALKITRIAVAHRPHTLELADRVICL